MLRSRLMVPILICTSFCLPGCPNDSPVVQPTATDTGSVATASDAGNATTIDAGGYIQSDAGSVSVDSGVTAQRMVPTRAITSGGGSGQNQDYKVCLIIGGPTAVGSGASELNAVQVGAGAAQTSP